jgi:hypothetical protein
MNSDTACAFSEGGPGLNLGEHKGDNSTLGTKVRIISYLFPVQILDKNIT